MAFNNEIEKTKQEIEVLTAKLALLEEIENHKTPCEEAFKRVYNRYPVTDVNDTCWDGSTWIDFKFGYIAAQKDYKVGEPEELKTLYDVLRELDKPMFTDDVCSAVKRWMSQYADNVLRGECKKGYEECLTINLTLKELETLDKYLELNDKTRPLFDKIRNAYPKPTTLFDVRGRGKCLI